MITVKPQISGNNVTMTLVEDESKKGYISFVQEGYIINILEFRVNGSDSVNPDNHYIFDTLIKACASYAFNHSCFYIYNSNKELYDVCSRMRFAEKDGKQLLTIDKIFNVCDKGDK